MKIPVNGLLVILMKNHFILWKISLKDFSYCKLHLLYAYQPKGKKEEVTDKDDIPEFIEENKISNSN